MATTTPNYGWPVPTSTDFVKDGATAIKALGDAIDTTVAGLGSGLTLIETKSFTTQSAVQFDNCFTSSYTNYRFEISLTARSITGSVNFRLVDGTTPITTTNWVWVWDGYTIANAQTSNYTGTGGANYASLADSNSTESDRYACSGDIYSPQLAKATSYTFNAFGRNASDSYSVSGGGTFTLSTQFEGIQFFPASGTFSGSISIYGYKK